jgi:PRTRC genetic system protein B
MSNSNHSRLKRENTISVAVTSGSSEEASYPFTDAILLYGKSSKIAIIHSVEITTEGPCLQAGRPLEIEALSEVVRGLTSAETGQVRARSILPASVLYSDATMLAWWTRMEKRQIWFRTGRKAMDALSGKEVWHPSLVFVATPGRLKIVALSGLDALERPNDETQVYVAPYYNLYADGAMCQGNAKYPKSLSPGSIPEWENVFFNTNFTHANTKDLLAKETHDTFWKESEWRRPGEQLLKHPTYKNLSEVLNASK